MWKQEVAEEEEEEFSAWIDEATSQCQQQLRRLLCVPLTIGGVRHSPAQTSPCPASPRGRAALGGQHWEGMREGTREDSRDKAPAEDTASGHT